MLFIVQWVVYAVSSALRTFPLSLTWKTSINILRLLAISPVLDSITDSPSVLVTMVHSQISLQNGGINLPRTTEFCISNCLLQKKQQTILILDSSIRFFGIQDCWVQEYECLGQLGQLGRAQLQRCSWNWLRLLFRFTGSNQLCPHHPSQVLVQRTLPNKPLAWKSQSIGVCFVGINCDTLRQMVYRCLHSDMC